MEVLGKSIVHTSKKFDFALHQLKTRTGETIERGFIDHPGSVVLIPRLADGRVVMVRQFRHPCRQVFLELPAGTADRGESLEVTAVRELAEETGYRAGKIERIFEMYPLPGASNEKMAFFRCTDLIEGEVAREIDEEMTVEYWPLEEALSKIETGEIHDGKTIVGLWLEARRQTAS
jgi:ADP-ribose pyrophosphatase